MKRNIFFIILLSTLFTSCSSILNESLSVSYLILLWFGVCVGFVLSDFVWGTDDPGNNYTPYWAVVIWILFTALGAFLGYVKYFFLFSGFLIAVFVPVIAAVVIRFILRIIRKYRKDK